jgi:D(-)-tartrate dehydratase
VPVRVVDVREHSVPISRFADPSLPGGGLTTSVVSVTTDVQRGGAPVVGYGFGSFGRYAQGGLIRERFAPRLLAAGAASALSGYGLRWLEDVGDPHDLEGLSALTAAYDPPVAAGEALFSAPEARLLRLHGGLRADRDILVFDPVHCYGVSGFLAILAEFESAGWPRSAFWPHGGHLFCQHLVAALGLGGAEVNPLAFQPFGGLTDDARVEEGHIAPPELPGIGFEGRAELRALLGLSLG